MAASLADEERTVRVQLWIGRVHYLAGRLPEAISYFQKVLTVAPKFGDPELMALPGAVIGRVLLLQGQFAKAHRFLDRTVPLLEATKNRHELLLRLLVPRGFPVLLAITPPEPLNSTRSWKWPRQAAIENAETMAHTAHAIVASPANTLRPWKPPRQRLRWRRRAATRCSLLQQFVYGLGADGIGRASSRPGTLVRG